VSRSDGNHLTGNHLTGDRLTGDRLTDDNLTVAEAALALRVSEKTVRRLIESGELRAFKPTKRNTRVPRANLDAFIESRGTGEVGVGESR